MKDLERVENWPPERQMTYYDREAYTAVENAAYTTIGGILLAAATGVAALKGAPLEKIVPVGGGSAICFGMAYYLLSLSGEYTEKFKAARAVKHDESAFASEVWETRITDR